MTVRNKDQIKTQLFTIGHSNRSFEEFLSLLKAFGIQVVADIRRYPSSRKFPHFNAEVLRKLLETEGIGYIWLEALGGRRYKNGNDKSPNIGLKSSGFRNYADYMRTDEFRAGIDALLSTASTKKTAIMCAERFYWKCHRRLLCDYLFVRQIQVKHIIETGKSIEHKLTPFAEVNSDGIVTYTDGGLADVEQKKLFEA